MQEKSVAGFISKNRVESNEVVNMYSTFNELFNSTKALGGKDRNLQTRINCCSSYFDLFNG